LRPVRPTIDRGYDRADTARSVDDHLNSVSEIDGSEEVFDDDDG